jgi:hypothetical protein
LVALFASAFAGKEEEKEKKKAEQPAKKIAVSKTEKRGAVELIHVPEGYEGHNLAGGYAGSYGYGEAGYELGGQHSLGLLGYGDHNLNPSSRIKSIVITKEVTIPVPQPYPVPVEKAIPYPVKVPVPVPVVKHYPVPVAKPYPVPVEKKVPYPVEKIVPYPVHIPVKVAVPVHYPVPVSHPVILKKPASVLLDHGDLSAGYVGLGGLVIVALDSKYVGHGDGYVLAGSVDGLYSHDREY